MRGRSERRGRGPRQQAGRVRTGQAVHPGCRRPTSSSPPGTHRRAPRASPRREVGARHTVRAPSHGTVTVGDRAVARAPKPNAPLPVRTTRCANTRTYGVRARARPSGDHGVGGPQPCAASAGERVAPGGRDWRTARRSPRRCCARCVVAAAASVGGHGAAVNVSPNSHSTRPSGSRRLARTVAAGPAAASPSNRVGPARRRRAARSRTRPPRQRRARRRGPGGGPASAHRGSARAASGGGAADRPPRAPRAPWERDVGRALPEGLRPHRSVRAV